MSKKKQVMLQGNIFTPDSVDLFVNEVEVAVDIPIEKAKEVKQDFIDEVINPLKEINAVEIDLLIDKKYHKKLIYPYKQEFKNHNDDIFFKTRLAEFLGIKDKESKKKFERVIVQEVKKIKTIGYVN